MTHPRVTPGQPLSPQQKTGLELVARLHGGRDVVLAIDLTESVGLNNEGRIRLRQIVEDSLKPGDSVYVVPFASDVVALRAGASDVYPLGVPIKFSSKSKENIDNVLQKIPLSADLKLQNTDIQRAELSIYQGAAQLNQNRLQQNQPIKPQSVVWITDAPLLASSGNEWIETPANSPFRVKDSPESRERQSWLDALPMIKRELLIKSDRKDYKLAIVDIAPSVQEFCTIAPSSQELCKVNPYLFGQLWLPASILTAGLVAIPFLLLHWINTRKKWRLQVTFESSGDEKECRPLLPGKSLAVGAGSNCVDEIDCPGSEVRAYLERKGNRLYLLPTKLASIQWNGREITKRTCLNGTRIKLNCPDERNRDFYIDIRVSK